MWTLNSGKSQSFYIGDWRQRFLFSNKLSAPGIRIECKHESKDACRQVKNEYAKLLYWAWWWQLLIAISSHEQNFRCLVCVFWFSIQPKKIRTTMQPYMHTVHDLKAERSYHIHTVCCLYYFCSTHLTAPNGETAPTPMQNKKYKKKE